MAAGPGARSTRFPPAARRSGACSPSSSQEDRRLRAGREARRRPRGRSSSCSRASGRPADVVVLTQPDDPAKLDALLERRRRASTSREEIDGWTAVAQDRGDARPLQGGAPRAHSPTTTSSRTRWSELPEDALVARLRERRGRATRQSQARPSSARTQQAARRAASAASGAAGGVGVRALGRGRRAAARRRRPRRGDAEGPDDGSSELRRATTRRGARLRRRSTASASRPAGSSTALARLGRAGRAPDRGQTELALGVSIEEDVAAALRRRDGRRRATRRRPARSPVVTSRSSEVDDEDEARPTLDKIRRAGGAFSTRIELRGRDGRRRRGARACRSTGTHGRLRASTTASSSSRASRAHRGDHEGGGELAADDAFGAAREAARTPPTRRAASLYVNLEELVAPRSRHRRDRRGAPRRTTPRTSSRSSRSSSGARRDGDRVDASQASSRSTSRQ